MAKILIIDDDQIIRERLKKLLELDDHEACMGKDGPEGLKAFDEYKPEIVIVDIKMPGMDGVEVLEKIKERSPNTEVIIITGHGGLETAIQSLRKGAFDYLPKPINYDELSLNIKRALEKKNLREQVDEYVHNLEEAHKQLKLQQAQLLQAAKLTAVGELGAGVAHEMNQPLMAISTHIESLLMSGSITSNSALKEKILKVKDQFVRLATIVRRIHDYSGSRKEGFINEYVNRPIQDALYLFAQQLKDHNIESALDLGKNLPKVFMDRYQIQDVVINFLVNARDAVDDLYNQKEGGQIRITSKKLKNNKGILVGVIDNGRPVYKGKESEIFNPFFTTKPAGKGTGLGLSVCYTIIKNHNGVINFSPLKKNRKIFYFVLPLDKDNNLMQDQTVMGDINSELGSL